MNFAGCCLACNALYMAQTKTCFYIGRPKGVQAGIPLLVRDWEPACHAISSASECQAGPARQASPGSGRAPHSLLRILKYTSS